MALINCGECRKQISDKSDFCVGCGAPTKSSTQDLSNTVEDYIAGENSILNKTENIQEVITHEENDNSELQIDKSNVELEDDQNLGEHTGSENIRIQFNKDDIDYRAFKITNIILVVFLYFMEVVAASSQGGRVNPAPLYLTLIISRSIIRYYFVREPKFRKAGIVFKIGATLFVWVVVFILKLCLALIWLNVVL